MKRAEVYNEMFDEKKTAEDYANEFLKMKIDQGRQPKVVKMGFVLNDLEQFFEEEIEKN